ncbi:MAG: PilW family protein [Gammaproteobacteria bacterium]
MKRHHAPAPRARQSGMTMIETMVAMAISSILILGAISVYNSARTNYRTAENLARLQESLRFATDTLDEDIRLAGYWGRTNGNASWSRDAAARVNCGTNDVTDWALGPVGSVIVGLDASDDAYDLPCPGNNPRANSDVVIVRHADTKQNVTAEANRIQVRTTGNTGHIFADGVPPQDNNVGRTKVYDVDVNAYYVSNRSNYDNALPSLRRRSLVGTMMQDEEIIAGVENLQVQFGIDRNGDDQVDGYVDDGHPDKRDDNVVSVRLWLLVRGDADETAQGYIDDNIYRTPDADGFSIAPDAGVDYPDSYRRYAFTRTIVLGNAVPAEDRQP